MRRRKSVVSLALMVLLGHPVVAVAFAQGTVGIGPFDPRAGKFSTFISGESARAPDTIAVSSDKVWAALIQVYGELGVALTVADTQSHVLGALRLVQRKPVGGRPLSRLLECGESAYGPNADRYTVQLTALTAVESLGAKLTAIDTRVSGSAAGNGASTSVACSSSGALEERVATMVRKALGL